MPDLEQGKTVGGKIKGTALTIVGCIDGHIQA